MNKILKKQKLAEDTYLMEINAPLVAKNAKPGQFVILRIDEKGERIPLTIADNTKTRITVVFQTAGHSTNHLAEMKKGNILLDIVGPLGNHTEIDKFGNVCLVGGGLGIAPLYPIAKAMKLKGNHVFTIIGAKTKKHLFWEDTLKKVSHDFKICTDDGSRGKKGMVTDVLLQLLRKKRISRIITVGPPVMMKAVAEMTRHRVKTIASINSIMVDGIGMCGGCRVKVDNKVKFSCVDGPEFDAHIVDWNELLMRNQRYTEEEEHKGGCNDG